MTVQQSQPQVARQTQHRLAVTEQPRDAIGEQRGQQLIAVLPPKISLLNGLLSL